MSDTTAEARARQEKLNPLTEAERARRLQVVADLKREVLLARNALAENNTEENNRALAQAAITMAHVMCTVPGLVA